MGSYRTTLERNRQETQGFVDFDDSKAFTGFGAHPRPTRIKRAVAHRKELDEWGEQEPRREDGGAQWSCWGRRTKRARKYGSSR